MLVSNLMPLLGPSLKIAKNRGCCCCKKKNYKPNRNLNPVFAMERRYAMVLNTMFLVFTYGFSLPALPIVGIVVISIQYFADKMMITYYFKERVEHEDLLNRIVLKVVKFGICVFYIIGALVLAQGYCTVYNDDSLNLKYVTEFTNCFQMWTMPRIMIAAGSIFFFVIVGLEFTVGVQKSQEWFKREVVHREENFFQRMSDSDRKYILATEHYRRKKYGI